MIITASYSQFSLPASLKVSSRNGTSRFFDTICTPHVQILYIILTTLRVFVYPSGVFLWWFCYGLCFPLGKKAYLMCWYWRVLYHRLWICQ